MSMLYECYSLRMQKVPCLLYSLQQHMEDARLLHEVPHAADTSMHRSLLSRIQDLTLHEVHAAMSRSLKHPYSLVSFLTLKDLLEQMLCRLFSWICKNKN